MRLMPATPMALSSPAMVVGIRHTSSATSEPAAPKPLAQPATERDNAKTEDKSAYSVALARLSTIDIRKARNAAVPSPPVNDSVALAP